MMPKLDAQHVGPYLVIKVWSNSIITVEKDNISIVFAGDLNSIRNVQLEFLPSIQKQWYVQCGP